MFWMESQLWASNPPPTCKASPGRLAQAAVVDLVACGTRPPHNRQPWSWEFRGWRIWKNLAVTCNTSIIYLQEYKIWWNICCFCPFQIWYQQHCKTVSKASKPRSRGLLRLLPQQLQGFRPLLPRQVHHQMVQSLCCGLIAQLVQLLTGEAWPEPARTSQALSISRAVCQELPQLAFSRGSTIRSLGASFSWRWDSGFFKAQENTSIFNHALTPTHSGGNLVT